MSKDYALIFLLSMSKMIWLGAFLLQMGRQHFVPSVQSWESSEHFGVFKTGFSLNSEMLYLRTSSKWSLWWWSWALREGRSVKTAEISKCFMEEIRTECDLETGLGHSFQCSHGLFLQRQPDSSIYTSLQSNARKYSEKLRNHRQFPSSEAILENLVFKCNYLKTTRVWRDELKSTKLALQQNA